MRLIFFAIGVIAVIALTGMNVYSLYALRESTIESVKESHRSDLEDFSSQVRYRFYRPFWGLSKLDMDYLQLYWVSHDQFPKRFRKVLEEAGEDSLYSDIYFTLDEMDGCQNPAEPVYVFDLETTMMKVADEVPAVVCDGFRLSKTNIKTHKGDFTSNNKVTFDNHHSMSLALINLTDMKVIGHLNFVIDDHFLVQNYLKKTMTDKYGPDNGSGLVVWLRDWRDDRILLSTNPEEEYSREKITIKQRFPDLFESWVLFASFTESPTIAASNASLYRNLIVLGFAVLFLSGAFVYMFVTAQRERELAKRQAGFLANVTHELKTPLAVMQAAGENIADGRVTQGERLKSYGDHIYHEAVRLRKMIEKLLDVAKADSGQTVAEIAPRRLDEIAERFYSQNRAFVEDKGFTFRFESDDHLPLVMADANHIETILNNLLENSMKYSTDRKEIDLKVQKQDHHVAVIMMDKGVGIPGKEKKRIFDKFYRVEDVLTARTKGHGLGLSIVKNLVELNGGTVDLQSKVGEGSVFTVKFPALFKEDVPETVSDIPSKKQTRIIETGEYAGK
ncbi:MAG: sensor histidine kinase [Balneolaceae bacterium]